MQRNYFKNLSAWIFILLLSFMAALFLFGIITHEVLGEKEESVDMRVFSFLSSHVTTPRLTTIMKVITNCASATLLPIAFGVIVLFYLIRKNWNRAIEVAAIGIGGFLINYFMKLFFHRPRPAHPLIGPLKNFSYPSGHATSGFIFYGLLVYLVWKTNLPQPYKWLTASILILFSLLIGFSRIYLRVHYASDVVAGFCIGIAWLALSVWLIEKIRKNKVKRIV
ncbi:MAG: phosphatase PAP2 family protein [Bacteroidetes bacterium]|nr:MAG: phosphatase PAP2 family protein [Bacteroidota bacterium]